MGNTNLGHVGGERLEAAVAAGGLALNKQIA
jgi:hypothetical protein